ncbi:MAG: hypothetical protein WAU78_08540 [Roseiarcus sp.]
MSLANLLRLPIRLLAPIGIAAPSTQPLGPPPRSFPLSPEGCYMAAPLARGDRCDV